MLGCRLAINVTALFVACICAATPARAQERTLDEYQIKALFIFNLVQFVEWPVESHPTQDSPIRIGILGDNPFSGTLVAATKNEKVNGRAISIERADEASALAHCHVVFVSRSERGRLQAVFDTFAGRPVLTVGDTPGFAERGGIINFYRDGEKVRFELNRAAAQAANLKLSSQLIRLGKPVDGSGGQR